MKTAIIRYTENSLCYGPGNDIHTNRWLRAAENLYYHLEQFLYCSYAHTYCHLIYVYTLVGKIDWET